MNTLFSFQNLAIQHSASCFLNSLFREWNGYSIASSDIGKHFVVSINENRSILIPIKKQSILGRHQYLGNFYLSCINIVTEICFTEMIEILCEYLSELFQVNPIQNEIFKSRVLSSLRNIHNSLEYSADSIRNYAKSDFSFKDSEQALIVGHNFHPTPKSRDEFNDEDMLKYSPEFGGFFFLDWFLAEPSIIYQKCAVSFREKKWTEELFLKDFAQTESIRDLLAKGLIPIPMHPWQSKILTQKSSVTEYIHDGRLIYLGKSKEAWTATSALRTIYRDTSPYMLKFSMSLKLTNSVRILLTREVTRGLLLHDVLSTPTGKKFLNENKNFKILTEPAYLCLKDSDGNPMDESIVVCRENPFHGQSGLGKIMIATLTQDDPLGGENMLQRLIYEIDSTDSIHTRFKNWFSAYLNIALKPLFIAYTNYGIIMEAHQQNLILDIKNGYPVAAYFRDCQDHAYSELGFKTFADDIPNLRKDNGAVVSEQIASRFFVYQVILNSTFNIISSLATSDHIDEKELLLDLRIFLKEILASEVRDPLCLNYLLDSPNLMHKGNFIFAFKSAHDNTIKDPLALFRPVQNSILINRSETHFIRPKPLFGTLYHHYFKEIKKTITLRILNIESDLETFHAWQNQSRVSQFWELNQSYEELRGYLEKGRQDPYQIQIIMEINGEPAGYSEIYWAAEDRIARHYECDPYDRGFHLLIGEKKFLGVENTTAIFQSIMHFLYLDDERTTRIVAEPRYDNERFLKYTKIIPGWRFVKEFDFPEKRAALLMSHRENFSMEGAL